MHVLNLRLIQMFAHYKQRTIYILIFISTSVVTNFIISKLITIGFFGEKFDFSYVYLSIIGSILTDPIGLLCTFYFLYNIYKKNNNKLLTGLKNYLIKANKEIISCYLVIVASRIFFPVFGSFFLPLGLSLLLPISVLRFYAMYRDKKNIKEN